jgi:hypothetical protein
MGEGGPGLAVMATCKGKTGSPNLYKVWISDWIRGATTARSEMNSVKGERCFIVYAESQIGKTQRRRRNRDPDLESES